jgi:hypothetical protein
MRPIIPLLAIALGITAASAAQAEVQISSETFNAASGKTSQINMYIAADRLKMDMENMAVIYRDDTGTVYNVMKDRHQYMAFDQATQQRMAAMMSAMKDQMRQQMQSMPEAQRKQMEASGMAGMAAPKPDGPYKKTGQSKVVGAWSCQVFRKLLGSGMTVDSCFAPVSAIGLTHGDLTALKALTERMRKAMPQSAQTNSMDIDAQTQEIGFEGFPVETVISANGTLRTTSTMKSVQHLSLPADTFEIPAGYTRREMPGPRP